MSLAAGEHQEELGNSPAEAEYVQGGLAFARNLQAVDPERSAPHVIGGGSAQRQGRDFPEVEAAIERRTNQLPVLDHGFF